MFSQLEAVQSRFFEIEQRLSDPSLGDQPDLFRKLSLEHASLQEIVETYRQYKTVCSEITSNKELLKELSDEKDEELVRMAWEELKRLAPVAELLAKALQVLLLPKDP